jgi:hypothetical protein
MRILYWNINNFSLRKIDPATQEGLDRRDHILNDVLLPNLPHIFVVVEVFARLFEIGTEGVPIVGNAQKGAMQLLDDIRNATGNVNWMLVPPVWSGMFSFCEGIAVYYDAIHAQFEGPYVYGPDYRTATQLRSGQWYNPPTWKACPPGRPGPTTRPAGTLATGEWQDGPQDYRAEWNGCLPAGQRRLAGQYDFHDGGGNRICFPSPFNRSPFLTHFSDLNPPGRTIKLFALHTSPDKAREAVDQLSNIRELAPHPGEVSVVLGDFNVDTFADRATYDGLTNAGFTLHFDSMAAGAVQANRRPYCLTHLLPRFLSGLFPPSQTPIATPYGLLGGVAAHPTHDVYPRFGYMGSMGGHNFQTPADTGAIDNVLTRYDPAGGAGGPAQNATIVNTVAGQPYGALAPAPANVTAALTGGLTYPSSLANAIPQPAGEDSTTAAARAATAGTALDPVLATFWQWNNFGRIRSTSDHLALVIDV